MRPGNIRPRPSYNPFRALPHSRLMSAVPAASTTIGLDHARRAAATCLDHKAADVVLLDLHGVTDMTDYFVVASGTSDTHVRAVARHVVERLSRDGVSVVSVEGLEEGKWVLLDFLNFVVHVFHPSMRSYYQLERLWGDAPELAVTP